MSAGTRVKCKKRVEGVEEQFPELQKFPFMKNYEITLIRGNYATLGQQNNFLGLKKISPMEN